MIKTTFVFKIGLVYSIIKMESLGKAFGPLRKKKIFQQLEDVKSQGFWHLKSHISLLSPKNKTSQRRPKKHAIS